MTIRDQPLTVPGGEKRPDEDEIDQSVPAGGARSAARRVAVQALYQWRVGGGEADAIIREFAAAGRLVDIEKAYFDVLVRGVSDQAPELVRIFDQFLDRPATQLDPIEYTILLVAAFELKHRVEIPYPAIIDQATQLARIFGATDGHRFVNAVADRLVRELRPHDPAARGRRA
ncbi:transcription antitermination factor NusB [Salinisphaera sp. USBA-960]|nr:transcription antitermination factor NusB [Salifodinibacter halophilus]NNC25329.1 transcription antitermination factor NusB [Salifodinibacter halophilus]